MFDTIPVSPESGLEELQLIKAFLITHSTGPVHQGCKNGLFDGRMVMRSRVQVEICGVEFSVAFRSQAALRSPTDVNVKKSPKSPSLSPWCVITQTSADLYFEAEP